MSLVKVKVKVRGQMSPLIFFTSASQRWESIHNSFVQDRQTEETEKKKHTSAIFLPPRNRFFCENIHIILSWSFQPKCAYQEFSLVSGVLFWVFWHPFKLRFCPTQTVRSSCLVLWRTNMNGAKFRWIFISTRGEWHIWIRRRVKSPKSVRSPRNLCSLYDEYCCVQLWIKTNSRTMSTWIHSSLR